MRRTVFISICAVAVLAAAAIFGAGAWGQAASGSKPLPAPAAGPDGAHPSSPATVPGASAAASSASVPQGSPVVLDSVVAAINGDIILESDVQEEMRFADLQSIRANPRRNTPRSALRRLIDRDLILQQMKATHARMREPSQEEVNRQISELRERIPECAERHCQTEAGWRAFISARGLTEQEVQARWRQRIMILSFIQSRFGAGVQISPAEIETYYKQNLAPQFTAKNLKPPPFDTVSGRIREILLEQHVNVYLLSWLRSLEQGGNVRILDPAYAGVASSEADLAQDGAQPKNQGENQGKGSGRP